MSSASATSSPNTSSSSTTSYSPPTKTVFDQDEAVSLSTSITTNMSGLSLDDPLSKGDHQTSPPAHPSDQEANLYYYGLPSRPVLVARTGSPWDAPTSPDQYPRPKQLRIVGRHEISDVWEDNLALKIHAVLEEKEVDWSSTDVIRIGYVDEPHGNVILWIGVRPGSLSRQVGINVASQLKKVLLDHDISDIDVEIRESQIIQSAGPRLLQPTDDANPTVDFREPFTPTLGITICARSTPWIEGTGGFFLDNGGDGKGLLLVTCRHVVFPRSDNKLYERKFDSQPRHDVLVLSKASFDRHLLSVISEAEAQESIFDYQRNRMALMAGREDDEAVVAREDAQNVIKNAEAKVKVLTDFHKLLSKDWSADASRIIGCVTYSPPIAIGAGTEQYTQDVAVINVDTTKIDPRSFTINTIDLGHKFRPYDLKKMMHPNSKNSHSFNFPGNRLLKLRGTITDDEMRHRNPTTGTYDLDDNRCIMVLKRGRTSGLTVGRANNIFSYTRFYFDGRYTGTSKEWAILPFDGDSGAFSKRGDSGSVVVDGMGRIGGLLTGGSGPTDSTDVTYVTPISFVLKTIRNHKSLAKAFPKSA